MGLIRCCKVRKRQQRLRQRLTKLQKLRILNADQSEMKTSPTQSQLLSSKAYSMDLLIDFCRQNWSRWTREAQAELLTMRERNAPADQLAEVQSVTILLEKVSDRNTWLILLIP